jgi:hypothetical protein
MFHIEPAAAEAPRFKLDIPNGQFSFRSLELPPALLTGLVSSSRAARLDLSGPGGSYAPHVDHSYLVLPSMAELSAGVERQSPLQALGEETTKWALPTVLDPAFDVQRPGSRDLADFG